MFLEKTDRLALVDFENNHINYKDLINNIKYYSEHIIPLKSESFGLIVMENRVEWIYSFFAIWDKKSPVITIDALSTPKEILYVLEDSHPELVACSNETEKNILEALTNYSLKDKIKVINVDNFKIEEEKLGKIKKSEFELYNPEKEETAVGDAKRVNIAAKATSRKPKRIAALTIISGKTTNLTTTDVTSSLMWPLIS